MATTLSARAVGSTVTLEVDGSSRTFRVVHQGNPDPDLYDASCAGTWLLLDDLYTTRSWGTDVANPRSETVLAPTADGHSSTLYVRFYDHEDMQTPAIEPDALTGVDMQRNRITPVKYVFDNGKVYIYYASSDTRMHVAVSSVDRLVDYCLNTPPDGGRSAESVRTLNRLIDRNLSLLKKY